jgi:PmbA protein
MKATEKLELARWVLARAKKAGAREAAANLSENRSVTVTSRESKIEELKESVKNSLSLAVYADGRYSSHRTNDLRKGGLEKFIGDAVDMTRLLGEDQYRSLPHPKYYERGEDPDLKLVDEGYDRVKTSERVENAREMEERALKRSSKLVSVTGYAGDSRSLSVKAHSNGFEGVRETTNFWSGVSAVVSDKGGGRPRGGSFSSASRRRDLRSAKICAKDAVERALGRVGQGKLASGRYDFVVENRVASKFLSALQQAMRGSKLHQKTSFLDGKLGDRIASEKLNFVDDPHIVRGLGSRHYDGDGIAARRRVFVENGVLKDYFIDDYYGKKLAMPPTTGGPSNALLEGGDGGDAERLVKRMGDGLFVTGFLGGNSNTTTGDFSYGIVGFEVRGGEIARSVNEMNVSGNLLDLWSKLERVGSDPWVYSSWRLPSLYFKDVDFSGV